MSVISKGFIERTGLLVCNSDRSLWSSWRKRANTARNRHTCCLKSNTEALNSWIRLRTATSRIRRCTNIHSLHKTVRPTPQSIRRKCENTVENPFYHELRGRVCPYYLKILPHLLPASRRTNICKISHKEAQRRWSSVVWKWLIVISKLWLLSHQSNFRMQCRYRQKLRLSWPFVHQNTRQRNNVGKFYQPTAILKPVDPADYSKNHDLDHTTQPTIWPQTLLLTNHILLKSRNSDAAYFRMSMKTRSTPKHLPILPFDFQVINSQKKYENFAESIYWVFNSMQWWPLYLHCFVMLKMISLSWEFSVISRRKNDADTDSKRTITRRRWLWSPVENVPEGSRPANVSVGRFILQWL